MCFFLNKKIKKLQNTVDELVKIVKTNELERLRVKEKELDNTQELLGNIRLKVKDIKEYFNENTGTVSVRIKYEAPVVTLTLDDDGVPNKDEFFYSSNMLNLISLEDMQKLQNFLNKYKNK